MRIEILVDGSVEPQIYPLDKPKMTIGSGDTCDIIVSSENISRKHVVIVQEGDEFFVFDQGSTNGSFINEERLVPGRKTEFTSFFPVRLGDHVLITLLSDADPLDEGQDQPLIPVPKEPEEKKSSPSRGDESTKMISLADLRKAKTSDLQAKREEITKRKASPIKNAPVKTKRAKENQKFKLTSWLILVALVAIGYYNIKTVKEDPRIAKMGEVVTADPSDGKKPEEEVKPTDQTQGQGINLDESKIPEGPFIDKQRYLQFLTDAKCITDMEKYFCGIIPGASGNNWGVVQIGTTMHIMIDGDAFIKEARSIVVHPPPDASGNYPSEVYEPYKQTVMNTALALFLMKAWPKDIDYEKIKDMKISIGLFEIWEGQTYIQMVAVAYPEMIKKYQSIVIEDSIKNVKEIGDNALNFTKQFYKTY